MNFRTTLLAMRMTRAVEAIIQINTPSLRLERQSSKSADGAEKSCQQKGGLAVSTAAMAQALERHPLR